MPSVRFVFVSYRTNLASLFSVPWCGDRRPRVNIGEFGFVDIGVGQVVFCLMLGLVPLLVAIEHKGIAPKATQQAIHHHEYHGRKREARHHGRGLQGR